MRTFGTETDNLILEEYHAGINRYNMILYHNSKKIDPYIKKLTVHFMGNSVPFGNISKHYFELNTDYMDFLEKDEVELWIEKNGIEIKVGTFYIKTINKGEYMASYTAFSSLLEPEKIALYKIDEDPEWRVAWNDGAKTIKEILDIFLKSANLSMAEYPSYDGTFVSRYADWENMTLSQLICACGILEGCNYVLVGNTFYPVRPSKDVAKLYEIGECVYSENLWQRQTDLFCGNIDVKMKSWAYENDTSEDPMMGFIVSFVTGGIRYSNPQSGTGAISAEFPLIPGENSNKIKDYMISKLKQFAKMDMNSYSIEYLGDAFIEIGDKVKFYDASRSVQFYPSEIIWEWDGGLRCTLKSEIVQESGTTEAEVSLKEIVNTINSVANTLQNVRYNAVTTKTLEADSANIGLLKVDQADIRYATIASLTATDAKITALESTTIKTSELYAKVAELDYIKSDHAEIANLKSTMITTDNLRAEVADLGLMTADQADIRYLTVSSAKLQFADINLANVEAASIGTMLAGVGLISDATIQNGHVTGYLDSVEVNANSITAGTLAVDRLIIRGSEKSLVYELNNISGALQSKSVDTLNGEILTPRTITADKLVAKSITANEIAAGTITATEIAANAVTAEKINVSSLSAISANIGTVTAGVIRSTNYIKDTSGMQLDLSNGSWDSKYTKIDSDGKISCSNMILNGGSINFQGTDLNSKLITLSYLSEISDTPNNMTLWPCGIDIHYSSSANMTEYNTSFSYSGVTIDGGGGQAILTADRRGSSLELYASVTNRSIVLDGGSGSIVVNDDVSLANGVSLANLYNSTYKNSGGLFNTSTALLINGNALNSQWAQMVTEYNGLYFGIRNDGGNTYFMPGNSNGWYSCYSYVGSDGQWHFANNVYLPGTLQANGLNMPSRTGTQTTAKPNCYIDTNGTFYKTSTASSMSVKDDIKLLESEELNPSRLYDVSIYQFKYKTTYLSNKEDTRYKKDMIGFILENLHENYPIAVDCHMDEAGKIIYDSWNEQYLIPAMLKLIQDQHKELINQSMKIQNLENRLLFMNA